MTRAQNARHKDILFQFQPNTLEGNGRVAVVRLCTDIFGSEWSRQLSALQCNRHSGPEIQSLASFDFVVR
jgi:hypothetical protein